MPEQSPESQEELHVASFIVHCWPDHLEAVKACVREASGLETGTESPEGKLVVLAEGNHERRLLDVIELLESQPGVLECILVYHERMPAGDANYQMIALNEA